MAEKKTENKQENSGRKLTKDEIERKKRFEELSAELTGKGYKIKNLTITPGMANVLGTAIGFGAASPFFLIYLLTGSDHNNDNSFAVFIVFFVLFLVSIVVHELLHGTGWGLFAENHFKSIAFGVVWSALMPYCTCKVALKKGQYIVGLLLPCIVLGIIPSVIACIIGNFMLLCYGGFMTICAGGDLLVFVLILKAKLKGDVLLLDHPTDVGLVAFVRE